MGSDTKKRGTEQSVGLPIEIIEEILVRVEVKSLLKFRSVSQSWLSLIDSDRFIKSHHLHYSPQNLKVIFNRSLLGPLWQCSLRSFLEKSIPARTHYLSEFGGYNNSVVVGSCNGLVCILKDYSSFFLLNPSTKICKELPRFDNGNAKSPKYFGFGWDELSGAYKVFAHMLTPEGFIGKIYSSDSNSWKMLESEGFGVRYNMGQFVGGKLYWISTNNIIWYLDLKTEMFGTVEQPLYSTVQCHRVLGVLGGCLCVVCDYSKKGIAHLVTEMFGVEMSCSITKFDVWVLKEYGVKESWLKLDTVSHVKELVDQQAFSAPFAVGQDDEILITCASYFLVYHPQDSELWPYKVINSFYRAHVYVESLVSPGK